MIERPMKHTPAESRAIADLLIAARKLIDRPEKWTKDVFAIDGNGIPVNLKSDRAVCFCSFGALVKASWNAHIHIHKAFAVLNGIVPSANLYVSNDAPETTHADVMRWFDLAIEEHEANAKRGDA